MLRSKVKFFLKTYIDLLIFVLLLMWMLSSNVQIAFALTLEDPKVKLTVKLEERYNDNITGVKHNAINDWITETGIGIKLNTEDKYESFEVIAELRHQFFKDNNNFNNLSEFLALNYSGELSRDDYLRVTEEFRHYEEPQTFEDAFGRTGERYSYFENRFKVDYTKEVDRSFSFTPYFENEINRVSHSGIQNSYLQRIGVEGKYRMSAFTYFLPLYEFSWREFQRQGHENVHTMLLGIRHDLSKQLFVEGSWGLDALEYLGGSHSIKPHVIVRVSDEIGPASRITFDYEKDNTLSAYTLDIFDAWRARAGFEQQLSQRLRGNLIGFYGESGYNFLDIQGTTKGVEAAIYYELKKNMTGVIKYKYLDALSTDEAREHITYEIRAGISAEL